jgi:hypothetical protein
MDGLLNGYTFNSHIESSPSFSRHGVQVSPHAVAKRSVQEKWCNLLERLTLNMEYKLPGIDWKKKVGDGMFGAEFGVKMTNRIHLHLCEFFPLVSCLSKLLSLPPPSLVSYFLFYPVFGSYCCFHLYL